MTNLFCTTTSYRRDPHSFLDGMNTAAYPETLYSRTDILGSIPGNILIIAKPMTQTTSSNQCFASFKENIDIFIYTHSTCTDPVYIYDRCIQSNEIVNIEAPNINVEISMCCCDFLIQYFRQRSILSCQLLTSFHDVTCLDKGVLLPLVLWDSSYSICLFLHWIA